MPLTELARVDDEVLLERHLISREWLSAAPEAGLLPRLMRTVAVMINEEDHIRLQTLKPGLGFAGLWARAKSD